MFSSIWHLEKPFKKTLFILSVMLLSWTIFLMLLSITSVLLNMSADKWCRLVGGISMWIPRGQHWLSRPYCLHVCWPTPTSPSWATRLCNCNFVSTKSVLVSAFLLGKWLTPAKTAYGPIRQLYRPPLIDHLQLPAISLPLSTDSVWDACQSICNSVFF